MNLFQSIRARIKARFAEADKSVLTNLAFLSAIALSTLLLTAVLAVGWWSDNFAPAVEVNGVSISVGEAKSRGEIESFRLNLESARVRARVSSGTLTSEEADAFLQQLNDAGTNLSSQLTSDMIDALLVAQLAIEKNVTIDQAAIDAAWTDETSTPELRLLRRISIKVASDPKSGVPTEATIAAAQQKADAIIAEIKAGGDVGAIAKRESSDAYAAEGGRIGWSTKAEDPLTDPAYAAAWALTAVGPTEAISQSASQLAIFYVDQIRPAQADPNFDLSATDAKISMDLYKKMVGERALRAALSEVVTAELLVDPVEQRDISYVAVPVPQGNSEMEEVLVRHILYSPNDDAKGAAGLDATDPAWAAAEAEAKSAYEKISAGASMESLAGQSDDVGSGEQGGLLGWAAKGSYVPAFETAVWADGLQVGDLLGPIKTEFGYHVMQFEGRRVGMTLRMEILAQALAGASVDFDARAAEALKEFEGMTTDNLGFTSRYSLNAQIGSAAWSLAAGEVSGVQTLNGQMVIFKVNAIEERALTEEQKATIKTSGYLVWLDTYRQTAEIAIDGSVVQEAGGSPAP
jgi:parvulin-like peptidyl-prolyl isomerase